ncbi:2-keto-4-pentenoate hydratase/2-oxohepta-3-ene-1,7-dioic acid hydratase (catechol pathway) [Lutibacter agarilyticus]|uniref:2-keto-4-pentenoate hydratase/2-oxohepta-3-ene-1,7-dioic acid hydratase (Catechol pathway) n=1 Tax=Lutibacter agarilyticus TaxID=1109740 RepID=A0A238WV11_9FLAO|nr:fumarylacetoacetate hydrolase family protein [Lutibacter agarilyticus]SNR50395.1 2-keto-4-pentenoate hydratase/2-oxohepta-3-ene-1,7-dioic acid hydratase (catechol pathway) [Lutibacter agarilyticus]
MKILAIGKNYVNNIEEVASNKNGQQIIFSKPESSLVTDNKDVEFPSFTNELIYEAELVIKIGEKGKNISEADAVSYISELGIGIDYTAKDVLTAYRDVKGPWDLAKGFDGAAPISSFKPISNFSDLNNINFDLKINGEQLQTGNTSLMIYNFAEIISYVSGFMTLEPGDLIFTGTPAHGTGKIFKEDRLQASIEGEILLDFKMV